MAKKLPDELERTFEHALLFQSVKMNTPQYGFQNTKKHEAKLKVNWLLVLFVYRGATGYY